MVVKLALVVRTDLGMSKGKIAAQVAHAAVAAVLRSRGTAEFALWLDEGQPKVVLKVASEEQLAQVARDARTADVPVEVIRDAGRTQIVPGTATCCAVGPAASEAIDRVVGTLSLL